VKVKIDIDTHTFIRFLLVVSAFVGIVFLLWKLLPVLMIILVAAFLAVALNKPVSALANKLPGHSRILATALSYSLFILILGGFLVIAVPSIVSQTTSFINSLPDYIQQLGDQRGFAADFITKYQLEDELSSFVQGIQGQAGAIAQGLGNNVVSGLSTVVNGFITMITLLVLTFLMLIEGPKWIERLWDAYANQELLHRHQQLIRRMYRVVTGYVNGQVVVAGIAACMAALTLFILATFFSIPANSILPLAVIIFVTSLIPMIGATIGAIIVMTVLVFNNIGATLIFLIYFVIYQQIENNVIQPTVQSRTVELSALTVFLAAIIGIMTLGLVGGILAIPVAGCLRVLLLDFLEQRRAERTSRRSRVAKSKA
jgi:predicted PurR-regulated permease PerM